MAEGLEQEESVFFRFVLGNGGDAMSAFSEAIDPSTSADRKEQLREQLLAYCCLDTYAMVRLWQVFAGQCHLQL